MVYSLSCWHLVSIPVVIAAGKLVCYSVSGISGWQNVILIIVSWEKKVPLFVCYHESQTRTFIWKCFTLNLVKDYWMWAFSLEKQKVLIAFDFKFSREMFTFCVLDTWGFVASCYKTDTQNMHVYFRRHVYRRHVVVHALFFWMFLIHCNYKEVHLLCGDRRVCSNVTWHQH
jgi:hypothetical protein